MKIKKVRGHNRRQRDVEKWGLKNLEISQSFRIDRNYDHTKIIIHPWCDISISDSKIPEPNGKTKRLMLSGLIDIYHSWKMQLDGIGQPYYLKIWLFEPHFSDSQVVCAVGDRINWYENLFFKPKENKPLQTENYGYVKPSLDELSWDHYQDEYQFDSNFDGETGETLGWFKEKLKKPHRTTMLDATTELYSFKKGDVWVGGTSNL